MHKSSIIKKQNLNTVNNNNTNNQNKIVNKLANSSSLRESNPSHFKNKISISSNKVNKVGLYPTKKENFRQSNNQSLIENKPKDLKIYEKLKLTNRMYNNKQTDISISKDLDISKLTEKNLKINKTQVRDYQRKPNNFTNHNTNNINSLNVTKDNIRTRNIPKYKINSQESINKIKLIGKERKINQEPHLTVATKNIIKIVSKSHHPPMETNEEKILIKKSSNLTLNRLKNQVNTSLEKPPPKKDYKFISNMFSNPENTKDEKDISD